MIGCCYTHTPASLYAFTIDNIRFLFIPAFFAWSIDILLFPETLQPIQRPRIFKSPKRFPFLSKPSKITLLYFIFYRIAKT